MSDAAGDLVLAVDLGTGGPKVGLVTVRGEIVWWEHTPVPTHAGPGGEQTQDAEQWWQVVRESVRRAAGSADLSRVVAVSVTGQWASTVPVDEQGRPVGPCVLWSDTRGAPYSRAAVGGPVSGYAPKPLATWLRRSGGIPTVSGDDPVGHILFLQHEQPDVVARARWLLEPVDYLTMRFTGVPAASHASMTGAWLTDNRSLATLAYDDVLVRATGVDASRLPPLVATGSVVGPVSPVGGRGARPPADGRRRHRPARPALGRRRCGCDRPGGAARLDRHHGLDQRAGAAQEERPAADAGLGPGPGQRVVPPRQQPGVRRPQPAVVARRGRPRRSATTTCWRRRRPRLPGAGGVVFTPWLTGERSPVDDRNARAGFHGIGGGTTRGHLTRAVLEGVALNATWLLGAAEKFVGSRLDDIRLVGGGARSDLWCQILADTSDRSIVRVTDPWLAGLRGASLFAALTLGAVDRGEVRGLVPTDEPFRPDPRRRATYDALVRELPKLYAAQKGFFRRRSARG